MHIKICKIALFLLLFQACANGNRAFALDAADASTTSYFVQGNRGFISPSDVADRPDKNIFFKIDQGFSYGRLLDQRMSNLHYAGPGGIISFGRYVEAAKFVSELSFARIAYHMAQPQHEGTEVNNPSFGLRYRHLRRMPGRTAWRYRLGAQADAFANVRMAPSLSNSFLYVDFISQLSPAIDIGYTLFLFERDWNLDFSLAASLFGYALRIPEYGASYQLGSDGSETLANNVSTLLHPGNYNHFVTGIFYKDSFGRPENPNRFRIGYVWDFYTIRGAHDLKTFTAAHQLVLELFFLVN